MHPDVSPQDETRGLQATVTVRTTEREGLYDITDDIRAVVAASGVRTGTVSVYVQGATAAVMIQENWDDSVQRDVVRLLAQLIPRGVWEHDRRTAMATPTSRPASWARPRRSP